MTFYHGRSRPVSELVMMSKIAADYLKDTDFRGLSELNKAIEGVKFNG